MKTTPDDTSEISWQEAVARLARERTIAVTYAAALKKYGDPEANARGSLAYGDAKADYDGIIAGLIVALGRKATPISLPDLEASLERGFKKREAFCRSVKRLAPFSPAGEKGIIEDVVKGAFGPLLDALKSIWLRTRDDSALIRKTIETQLEATAWPDFALVSPTP